MIPIKPTNDETMAPDAPPVGKQRAKKRTVDMEDTGDENPRQRIASP